MITEADVHFPDIPFKKTAILTLIGLIIYFGYLYVVGFESVETALLSVNYWYIGLACLAAIAANVFHAAGWWIFLKDLKYKISLFDSFLIYMSATFFVNLIPSAAISGEVAKIYFVQKMTPDTRFDRTLAAGLLSRLLEIVPVALGTLIGVGYLAWNYDIPFWVLAFCVFIAGTVSLAAITILIISFNSELLMSIFKSIYMFLHRIFKSKDLDNRLLKMNAIIQQFDVSIRLLTRSKSLILKSLCHIFMAFVLDVYIAFIAFKAIGYPVSMGIIITIFSIMMILQMLPTFLPGGVGLVDIIMTLLYLSMGVPEVNAAGATILIRFVTLWFLTAAGGLVTLHLSRRLEKDQLMNSGNKFERPS
ncbi:TIGR00374 family protein [Methanocella sp. CWC-04]|uniref:TIGR00374 family protein n=1 Tax=Methanooceanicella nereidis TaxID=2052831 RepID=A0AAP2RF70_9EURY|nr:lysylphosphatidylglycerol synthase transmembrane domain-containing protein [Methanocella sp. CWC-04]MCD1296274.1 TIGR00374 family protein [Methanocella sp. CWC-04]